MLKPRDIDDIVQCLRYARRHGLRVAARGVGHSAGGQAQADGGVVIDMTALGAVRWIDEGKRCFEADGGASWSTLMQALVPLGWTPPVVTDWLHLSLGGTLSTGGVGAQSYLHGLQSCAVEQLEVVTGRGERAICSRERERGLFDAARAGLGQFGVIARAHVAAPRAAPGRGAASRLR